jgi:hypothetical protein
VNPLTAPGAGDFFASTINSIPWSLVFGGLVALVAIVVLLRKFFRAPAAHLARFGHWLMQIVRLPLVLPLAPLEHFLNAGPGQKLRSALAIPVDKGLESVFALCAFLPSGNLLLRGKRREFAEQTFPPDRYPHLYVAVPPDLRRSVISDGRLPDGSDPSEQLSASFITTPLVGQAFRRAVLFALASAVLAALLWHPAEFSRESTKAMVKARMVAANSKPVVDYWDQEKLTGSNEQGILAAVQADLPSGVLTIALFAATMFIASWLGLVRRAIGGRTWIWSRECKESTVRYKYRLEQRTMEFEAYKNQIALSAQDTTPLFTLGTASGLTEYRGLLSAPRKDAPIKLSLADLGQHLFVAGGTGEGKTRGVLLPLMAQILDVRAQMRQQISIFATDGKGVLHGDINRLAQQKGQGADVKVIGMADGEYGVDLLDGVDPQTVADILRSVMRQSSGSSGSSGSDDFWPSMASELIRQIAILARAWELTDDGIAFARETGERVYSLVGIYRITINQDLQGRAVNAVYDAILNDQWQRVSHAEGLRDSIDYLRGAWLDMAKDTKTGILANVTNVLAGFTSNSRLRRQFASGAASHIMSMGEAWGSVVLTNLNSVEHGAAGRVVLIFLKTLLFREARLRELKDPATGRKAKMIFVADEYQDLVTADNVGLSDANFWNVARSAGVVGIVATQSRAAIEQAIGKVATDNFLTQFRSKVFLRVEDPETIEYAKSLAGKTLRTYTFDRWQFESLTAAAREGLDPLARPPIRLGLGVDLWLNQYWACLTDFFGAASPLHFAAPAEMEAVDMRFVPGSRYRPQMTASQADGEQRSALQAATWRAEDLNREYLREGSHEVDVLRDDDVMQMGRAHAFVYIQRAGAARCDIVKL